MRALEARRNEENKALQGAGRHSTGTGGPGGLAPLRLHQTTGTLVRHLAARPVSLGQVTLHWQVPGMSPEVSMSQLRRAKWTAPPQVLSLVLTVTSFYSRLE